MTEACMTLQAHGGHHECHQIWSSEARQPGGKASYCNAGIHTCDSEDVHQEQAAVLVADVDLRIPHQPSQRQRFLCHICVTGALPAEPAAAATGFQGVFDAYAASNDVMD